MENDQLGTNSAHTIDLKAAGWTEPPTSMLIYRLLTFVAFKNTQETKRNSWRLTNSNCPDVTSKQCSTIRC